MNDKRNLGSFIHKLEAGADGTVLQADSALDAGVGFKVMDAANIGAGAVSNTEFGYLDGVTSAIQTQLTARALANTQGALGLSTPHWAGTTGGTSTAYTCNTTPAYVSASAAAGDTIFLKFNQTNGATPTLAVGTLAAKPILVDGVVPSSSAIVTTKTYRATYDGTSWDCA